MSIEQCRSAIMAMQSQPGGAKEASKWLSSFEESSEAWQAAWELVSGDGDSQELQMYRFFGAKMIYSKIQRDFSQLGAEEVPAFTQRLVERVIDMTQKYAEGDYFIVCRYLCLAIAAMALQVNREGVVSQILIWFNPILQTAPQILLELLLVLPEESVNYHINVSDDTRDIFAYQLTESYADVMTFLTSQYSSPQCAAATKVKVMRCMAAWIESTFVSGSLVASQPLFQTVLACLNSSDPDVLEVAVGVVISTFQRFGSANGDIMRVCWPSLLGMKQLWHAAVAEEDCEEGDPAYMVCKHVSRVITEVCDNCTRFLMALPSIDNNNNNNSGSDENALTESKKAMMELLLECASHNDQEIATIPLSFLSNLVEDLTELYYLHRDAVDDGYSPDSSSHDSHSLSPRGNSGQFQEEMCDNAEDTAKWNHCWQLYSPTMNALLTLCTRHCAGLVNNCMLKAVQQQVQTGNSGTQPAILSEEEGETRHVWIKMGTDISELLDRVHGPSAPLVAIAQHLKELTSALSDVYELVYVVSGATASTYTDVAARRHTVNATLARIASSSTPVQIILSYIEAHLAMLATALPFVESNEASVLPWLYETLFLQKIPGVGAEVRKVPQYCLSLIKSLGASSRWLCKNPKGNEYLPHVLEMLSTCLGDTVFQLQAAQSMRDLLSKCGDLPGAQLEAMKVHALLVAARGGSSGTEAGLPLPADLHLLEGISEVLSSFSRKTKSAEEQREVSSHVGTIVQPMIDILTQAVIAEGGGQNTPPPPPNNPARGTSVDGGVVLAALDRLCVVLQRLDIHPDMYLALLKEQVLGLLQAVLEMLPYSAKLCEKVCRCYKHSMRQAGRTFSELLHPLLVHLTTQFAKHPDAGFIYIVAISIGEFGRNNCYDATQQPGPLFLEAISTISNHFFSNYTTPAALEAGPDVAEEYFCLLEKCINVAPALYFHFVTTGNSGIAASLYPAAVATLNINHRDVHRGAVSFFSALITTARNDVNGGSNQHRRRQGGGRRGKNRNESPKSPEDLAAAAAIQAAAVETLCSTVGAPLVSAIVGVIYSADYKFALGGDTDKQCLLLLGLVRVLMNKYGQGQTRACFAQWYEAGIAAVEAGASGSDNSASTNAGATNSGTGSMKPRVAVQKTHVIDFLLREEEEEALDALYRSHTLVCGRNE